MQKKEKNTPEEISENYNIPLEKIKKIQNDQITI